MSNKAVSSLAAATPALSDYLYGIVGAHSRKVRIAELPVAKLSELTPAEQVAPTDLFGVYDVSAGEFRSTTPGMMGTPVSITQLGASAVASSATNFAALVLAISLAAHVVIPPGDFDFGNNNVPVTNKPLCLEGRGMGVSIMTWNGASGGLSFTQNSHLYHVTVKNLTLAQEGAAVGTAISYDGSGQKSGGSIANRSTPRMTLDKVLIKGATASDTDGWDVHVRGINLMRLTCDGLHMSGHYDTTQTNIQSTHGVYLTGDGAPVEVSFQSCWGFYLDTAVQSDDYEGILYDNCTFVNVNTSIKWRGHSPGQPHLGINNCHLNPFVTGIDAENLAHAKISDNLFYSNSVAPGAVTIIKFGENCTLNTIEDNTFVKAAAGSTVGVDLGTGSNINGNSIWNNKFVGVDIAIELGTTAANTHIRMNRYVSGVGTQVSGTGTGTIRHFDGDEGTASRPAMSFSLDPDTGLWNPSANELAASVGGVEAWRQTATGLGIGTTGPARRLHPALADAVNNAVSQLARLTHTTSGTPQAGIGVGMEFEVETADGNNEVVATIEAVTTDVTGGSEDADVVVKSMAGGAAAAERARFKSDGRMVPGSARLSCLEFGTWHVLAASAVQANHTGDTNETVLATVSIPAGAIGPNGILRIKTLWSNNNSGNNKTERVRLGGISGTIFHATTRTTQISQSFLLQIHNRNAQNSQVTTPTGHGTGGIGPSSAAITTASVDTSAAQDLVFTAQLANGADNLALEAYSVEVFYKA